MGPSCPRCKKSDYSYQELLMVHPYRGELRPAPIICPSCGQMSRVTAKSRLLAIAIILAFPLSVILLVGARVHLHKAQVVVLAIAAIVVYYYAIWPFVVRLKPWSEFYIWQPKDRLLGYFGYLLPAAVVALLFYMAVRFKIGM